jgi:hypothetical protein
MPQFTTTGILSPMHTAAAAVAVKTPVDGASGAVPPSTKKTNVFGKLLSGGKKMLTAKRTPAKSADKIPAPQSSSRARGSLLPPGSAAEPSKAVPHMSPELPVPVRDPSSEAVDETANLGSASSSMGANDEVADPIDGTPAVTMEVSPIEPSELMKGAHFEARPDSPASTPGSFDTSLQVTLSSPVASSPEKPLLSSDAPAVQLTAADVLSGLQEAEEKSPASPRVVTEQRVLSSPSPAKQPQPAPSTAPPSIPEKADLATTMLSFQGGKPCSVSTTKSSVSVKGAVVLKPSSHAMKLEQIREKQKAANLQKDKERQEREADREQRIQAQKERAMKEKILQKQALKQKAEKNLEEYHGSSVLPSSDAHAHELGNENRVAPAPPQPSPRAPAVPAAPAAPAAKSSPAKPLQVVKGAALPTSTSTAAKISASIHKDVEVEAQQRADLAAKQAAADEYDSYCMSEPEEQEQDNSDEDEQRGKASKRVPSWANKESLRAALKQQAELKIDPDAIFFECNTCSLEEIFERTSKR